MDPSRCRDHYSRCAILKLRISDLRWALVQFHDSPSGGLLNDFSGRLIPPPQPRDLRKRRHCPDESCRLESKDLLPPGVEAPPLSPSRSPTKALGGLDSGSDTSTSSGACPGMSR